MFFLFCVFLDILFVVFIAAVLIKTCEWFQRPKRDKRVRSAFL